jgi:hypothetical protein
MKYLSIPLIFISIGLSAQTYIKSPSQIGLINKQNVTYNKATSKAEIARIYRELEAEKNRPKPYPHPIKGITISNIKKLNSLIITMGSEHKELSVGDLKNGIEVIVPPYKRPIDAATGYDYDIYDSLYLKIVDNKLYAACKLTDIEDGKTVGRMSYDHWSEYNSKFKMRHNDDRFEIRDKNNYIIFALKFTPPNKLLLQGYFIGLGAIRGFSDPESGLCIWKQFNPYRGKTWQEASMPFIKEIKSVYPKSSKALPAGTTHKK